MTNHVRFCFEKQRGYHCLGALEGDQGDGQQLGTANSSGVFAGSCCLLLALYIQLFILGICITCSTVALLQGDFLGWWPFCPLFYGRVVYFRSLYAHLSRCVLFIIRPYGFGMLRFLWLPGPPRNFQLDKPSTWTRAAIGWFAHSKRTPWRHESSWVFWDAFCFCFQWLFDSFLTFFRRSCSVSHGRLSEF